MSAQDTQILEVAKASRLVTVDINKILRTKVIEMVQAQNYSLAMMNTIFSTIISEVYVDTSYMLWEANKLGERMTIEAYCGRQVSVLVSLLHAALEKRQVNSETIHNLTNTQYEQVFKSMQEALARVNN